MHLNPKFGNLFHARSLVSGDFTVLGGLSLKGGELCPYDPDDHKGKKPKKDKKPKKNKKPKKDKH